MVKIDYENIKDHIRERHSIQLTRRQVQRVLNANNALKDDLRANGGLMDTSSREWFIDALCKFIGINGRWPLAQDSESYTFCFFETFKQAASQHKIKLLNGRMWGKNNG